MASGLLMSWWQNVMVKMRNHFGLTGDRLNFWVMVCCSTAMLLFGYDQGVFGSILTMAIFADKFGVSAERKYPYDVATRQGWIVGSYDLGCLAGAIVTFAVGGWLGRKKTIFFGTVIMMVGAFLQTFSDGFVVMVLGRVIAGIGNGANTVTAPIWATECSSPKMRGRNGIVLMVVNILGLAVSCWLTYGFSFLTSSEASWRFPLAFQVVFGVIILNTVPWLPESPRWLMTKMRESEALKIMVALEGNGVTAESEKVVEEFEAIKDSIAVEQSKGTGTRQIMPWFRVLLGVGCQAMQQLTGINIICYYLPVVLNKSVGLSAATSRLLSGVNATTYLLATFIGLVFIEKWGRRRLMMYGAAGQCFCWLLISALLGAGRMVTIAKDAGKTLTGNAIHSSLTDSESPMEIRLAEASVVFFFVFNIFFGAGWQGVSWLYPTEINTTQKRNTGMAFGVGTNWLINFGVVFGTPKGIESLGYKYYIIWTVLNLSFVPIIYFFYPETSSRSLEVIDSMFEAHPTPFVYKYRLMTLRTLTLEDEDGIHAAASQRCPSMGNSPVTPLSPVEEEAPSIELVEIQPKPSNRSDSGRGSSADGLQPSSSGGRISTVEPMPTPNPAQIFSSATGF